MINAGAIAAVSLIPASSPDERFALIQDFYSAFAGRRLEMDRQVYMSERATGSRNRAIGYMLQSFGVLDDDPDEVLDVYYRQCSLEVTSTDLARMGATLARGGINPMTGRRVTGPAVVKRTLSVMVTCGMYDAAGDWVSAVGMPAKSGVGGGIVAVLPGQLGIGVYSPLLDAKGNSVRGVRLCRSLSEQLGLHFLTASRDSRATMRSIYRPRDNISVYEAHGDLLFSGAEQVVRTVDRERDSFDVAVLDVKLSGPEGTSLGVAEALAGKGTPFVFLTGMRVDDVHAKLFPEAPVIEKPYDAIALLDAVRRAIEPR